MLEFSDKIVVGKVYKNITQADIEAIIVGVFEGGSNYWIDSIDNTGILWKDKPKDEPISTWATKLLLDGKMILIYVQEDEFENTTKSYVLDLQQILDGIQLNMEQRPDDCDLEEGDAVTYDCILQYALFEDIIYG